MKTMRALLTLGFVVAVNHPLLDNALRGLDAAIAEAHGEVKEVVESPAVESLVETDGVSLAERSSVSSALVEKVERVGDHQLKRLRSRRAHTASLGELQPTDKEWWNFDWKINLNMEDEYKTVVGKSGLMEYDPDMQNDHIDIDSFPELEDTEDWSTLTDAQIAALGEQAYSMGEKRGQQLTGEIAAGLAEKARLPSLAQSGGVDAPWFQFNFLTGSDKKDYGPYPWFAHDVKLDFGDQFYGFHYDEDGTILDFPPPEIAAAQAGKTWKQIADGGSLPYGVKPKAGDQQYDEAPLVGVSWGLNFGDQHWVEE